MRAGLPGEVNGGTAPPARPAPRRFDDDGGGRVPARAGVADVRGHVVLFSGCVAGPRTLDIYHAQFSLCC